MIGIVDYGAGNLGSIVNMFKKAGVGATVSADPTVLCNAKKLVLPGVGSFDNGMRGLADRGLLELLTAKVIDEKVPVLGLCLGMQLFTDRSEEGGLPGLGWIHGTTKRFAFESDTNNGTCRVPHMGWNTIDPVRAHPIFENLPQPSRFYFVHSYHVVPAAEEAILARCNYGYSFVCAVVRNNIIGLQFHPEKSHRYGLQIIRNFIEHC